MSENRSFDGRNNNKRHPGWGSAGTVLRRVGSADYGNNDFSPRNVNPRLISNLICAAVDIPSTANLSDFTWAWGQFIDHEIDLSPESGTEEVPINIPEGVAVPEGVDPVNAHIPFSRSEHKLVKVYNCYEFDWLDFLGWFDEIVCELTSSREQINVLSAYIDGANVYGANCKRATFLRRLDGSGKLKSELTRGGEFLPKNPGGLSNAKVPPNADDHDFYIAGDVRSNEHGVLTSMHTLFVREHNRLCDEILDRFPEQYGSSKKHEQDEAIYQAARKVVGAMMQVITYKAFLPAILGEDAIPPYCGYDRYIDATIANEFSTAFYRLGHSMLSETVPMASSAGEIALREMFFNPARVQSDGIETFLGKLHTHVMQNIDRHIIDSVRNFLFNPPGVGPELNIFLDLVSLNIQRGRDHGLPNYNDCRVAYGLTRYASFSEISSNPDTVQALENAYPDVDAIDPWVGALVEDHVAGAEVGELIKTTLLEQFLRLRDGDRFWWENDPAHILSADGMGAEIEEITLSQILNRNLEGGNFPADVFHVG